MHRIIHLDETESTNVYTKKLAAEGEYDICVVADRQTGGRGRLGRTFESPEGGLYMSFVYEPGEQSAADDAITARAAVATARAIEELTGLSLNIKWVNDLYCGGRKICGILAEGVWENGKPEHIIIGIGVNLTDGALTDSLRNIATSVEAEGGMVPEREVLAQKILEKFEKCTDFREEYRRRQFLLGCPVTVHRGNETFPATAEDLDENCAMILRLDNGEKIILSSGEVSLRRRELDE